jgi:hypothetical protein
MNLEWYTKEELIEFIRDNDSKSRLKIADALEFWMIDKVTDDLIQARRKSNALFVKWHNMELTGDPVDLAEFERMADRCHEADLETNAAWQRLKEFQDEFLDAVKDEVKESEKKAETLSEGNEEDENAARRQREGDENEDGH